jgi:hypothetical protein
VTQVSAPKAALRAKSSLARGARRSLKVAAADKWAALDPKYDTSDDQQVRAASRFKTRATNCDPCAERNSSTLHAPRGFAVHRTSSAPRA